MEYQDTVCPICSSKSLIAIKPVYPSSQLFKMWHPLQFSQEVIDAHCQKVEQVTMYHCNTCQVDVFLPFLEGSSQFYKELVEGMEYYENDKWDFHQAIKDAQSSESIIEIGCGIGVFLSKASKFIKKCVGTEYNTVALKKARAKNLEVYGIDDNITDLKNSFDIACSFHVLEHVPNPIEFIEHLKSFVKKDGKIILSVPNQDGVIQHIEPCIMNMPPHHLTRWRLKTFEEVAKRLNLSIEKVAYEPLMLKSHSYYSYYLMKKITGYSNWFNKILHFLISRSVGLLFLIPTLFGIKYTNLFRGMAIYVVLKKND